MPSVGLENFVLDTNVILHDSNSIHHFGENDIVIPITVLEELDNFKKGNESLNFHARELARTVDSLSSDMLFGDGVSIGPGLGVSVFGWKVSLMKNSQPILRKKTRSPNSEYSLPSCHGTPRKTHYSVTKDVNLRVKAKAVGLMSQDYKNDHVSDVQRLYTGSRIIDQIDDELITEMYKPPYEFAADQLNANPPLTPNEYLILRSEHKSALAAYDEELNLIRHVDKIPALALLRN